MVSPMWLEVDAKVGLVHFSPELWPDDTFGGAKSFLTCTKVKTAAVLTCCIADLHTGRTAANTRDER